MEITFKEITKENYLNIIKLDVNKNQTNFVASNLESLKDYKDAIDRGLKAKPLGIYLNDKLIGFIMIGFDKLSNTDPNIASGNYSIWRFMIDKHYQNKGYGTEALKQIINKIKILPNSKNKYIFLSYEKENITARSLYYKLGFRENGEISDGEIVAVLKL